MKKIIVAGILFSLVLFAFGTAFAATPDPDNPASLPYRNKSFSIKTYTYTPAFAPSKTVTGAISGVSFEIDRDYTLYVNWLRWKPDTAVWVSAKSYSFTNFSSCGFELPSTSGNIYTLKLSKTEYTGYKLSGNVSVY